MVDECKKEMDMHPSYVLKDGDRKKVECETVA